ncbi:MAG TPA: hypothetical protein VJ377_10180 [Dehalococcoidales bacterium]|nr:hypothetical protein [Dehalococcoidales bacterium]
MPKSQYEKYAVKKPNYEAGSGYQGRQSPTMTFMSGKQVPEVSCYIELGWIYEMPSPNPHIHEHVHDYDEIVLHWGGNPEIPQVLGGEIEFWVGGQPITFNTTTGMFIPRGVPHGPLIWKKFEFPHVEMAMMLGTGDPFKGWGQSGIREPKKGLPVKKDKFDYEQYAIRSPLREAGPSFKEGRQSPTMTYMSRTQINIVNYYIEFGWIWDVPKPGIPEMRHDKWDEIVLHIGGDPANPEDLGADMEFGMGGDLLQFDTSYAMYIPKGLNHGPLNWHRVRKPHIEMAIMLGAGTVKEGWEGSFFGRPGGPPLSQK